MEISILRLSGIFLSLMLVVTLAHKMKKNTASNFSVLLLVFFSTFIFTTAVYPQTISYFSSFFLSEFPGARLITLLGITLTVIFAIVIYIFSLIESHRKQLDGMCRYLALQTLPSKFKKPQTGLAPVVVIIPVFNEADNLTYVLNSMPKMIGKHRLVVILIDDGSTDQTEQIIPKQDIVLIKHPINRGGGAAIRTGFQAAMFLNPIAIVTMDGDGQHDPSEIKELVGPVITGHADCVIGSRVLAKQPASSLLRGTGIALFSFVISVITRQKITDCSSGFRVFSSRAVIGVKLRQDQYHTAEMIIELSKLKLQIVEIPVKIKARLSGQSKKGPDILYGINFMIAIINSWLRA